MWRSILFGLGVLVTACSGSTATIDPPGGGASSGGASSGGASSGGVVTTATAPADSSFPGAAAGCRDVTVYRANADGTQFLVVNADKAKLGLEMNASRTFDLAHAPDGLEVGVEVFARAPGEAPYCSDIAARTATRATWSAEGGTISIQLQATGTSNGPYFATVRLKDVRLVGPERGVAVSVPRAEIGDVLVGWSPG